MTAIRLMLGFLLVCTAIQAAPKLSMVIQEPWNDVFGGKEVVSHVLIVAREAAQGRVVWCYSAGDKTIARQEREISVAPGRPVSEEVRLPVPEVKEGVILNTTLSVSVIENGASQATATLEKTLWVFPPDPFAGRTEWLKKLDLRLLDPEKRTADSFEKAGIPFQRVANMEALAEVKNGIIIVGEGISFNDFKGLPSLLFKAAARGASVLCLAPSGGTLSLPGTGESELPVPRSMKFDRNKIITSLDKRLDAVAWPPDGVIAVSTMALRSARGAVVGEVEKGGANWSWLEMSFNDSRGMFILCHFAIVEKWETGPAPRYLLAGILEYLASRQQAKD